MKKCLYKLNQDICTLLSKAPEVINSFYPGHWELMLSLEKKAQEAVKTLDVNLGIKFFSKVAFLKQPFRDRESELVSILSKKRQEIYECLKALKEIDRLDYEVMDTLSKLPYFPAGRPFSSAVLRLVKPEKFGIIDWRNLAVMGNCCDFKGLVEPLVYFNGLSCEKILTDFSIL